MNRVTREDVSPHLCALRIESVCILSKYFIVPVEKNTRKGRYQGCVIWGKSKKQLEAAGKDRTNVDRPNFIFAPYSSDLEETGFLSTISCPQDERGPVRLDQNRL